MTNLATTTSQANSWFESKTIGETPQAVSLREPGPVLYREFGVAAQQPLRGGVPIADFVRELEANPDMATRLAKARRTLARVIDAPGSLRHLRLAAGLSQAKFAELALTTQSYIARIEAGSADPGTDMLARLASALGVEPVTVFTAVRTQRAQEELRAG